MSSTASMSLCADVLSIIFDYLGEDHVAFAKEYLKLENRKMSIDRKYMLNKVLLANICLNESILRLYTKNCNFSHSHYGFSEIRFFSINSVIKLCTFIKNTFGSMILTEVKVNKCVFGGGVLNHANITKSSLTDCIFNDINIRYMSLINTEMSATFECVYIGYMNISMSLHIDVVFKRSKINIIYIIDCSIKRGVFHDTIIHTFNSKCSKLENLCSVQMKINKISLEKSKTNSSKFTNITINCGEIVHTDFNNSIIENIKILDAAIENTKINHCEISGDLSKFENINLKGVVINFCILNIIFEKCKLYNVRFSQCELNIEFHDCELTDCIFDGNTTKKVLFVRCKFTRCVDLQDSLNAIHIESINTEFQ